MSSKQLETVPPKQSLPSAGVGPSPSTAADTSVPCQDLMKALQLLQSVMSAEDFSQHEKMVLLHPRDVNTTPNKP